MKTTIRIFLTVLAFLWLAAPGRKAQAVSPPPDGCYPGFTTAEGCNALKFLTTGAGNTGIGWYSLSVDTTGNFNTGVGAGTLLLNKADSNTAVGTGAMLLNNTGTENVAIGTDALVYNDTGNVNTAAGAFALFSNIDGSGNSALGDSALAANMHAHGNTAIGDLALNFNDVTGAGLASFNTAVGSAALFQNTDGDSNTAVGWQALSFNGAGFRNTANGVQALTTNTTGSANTAMGFNALIANATGSNNTAVGENALLNSTGDGNIAVGVGTGDQVTTASNVICIGASGANVTNSAWIGLVYGTTTQSGTTLPVIVSNDGQLGTMSSSRRFKKEIKPMGSASEPILALQPMTFEYKTDRTRTPQFGLVAEDVARIDPNLVVRDDKGQIYSVRYDAVNAMLLNEFLKEHRKVEQQQATITELKSTVTRQEVAIAQQRKDLEATITELKNGMKTAVDRFKEQDAKIQRVSDQIELSKPVLQTVAIP